MKTGPPDPPAGALVDARKSRICESRTPARARWTPNHVPLLGLRADDPENPSHHVPDPSRLSDTLGTPEGPRIDHPEPSRLVIDTVPPAWPISRGA